MESKLTKDSLPEFKGQIVDIFEDYLADNDVTLKSSERDDAITDDEIDEDDAAIIFGSLYDYIADTVDELIDKHTSVLNKTIAEHKIDTIIIPEIIASYNNVLHAGKSDYKISDSDTEMLRAKIKNTFIRWHITA